MLQNAYKTNEKLMNHRNGVQFEEKSAQICTFCKRQLVPQGLEKQGSHIYIQISKAAVRKIHTVLQLLYRHFAHFYALQLGQGSATQRSAAQRSAAHRSTAQRRAMQRHAAHVRTHVCTQHSTPQHSTFCAVLRSVICATASRETGLCV